MSSSKENTVLSAAGISIGYGKGKQQKVIAKDVNIALKKGCLTALVGANGIGKSTLLRTVTGIQKPLSGEVLFNHKNIENYTGKALAQRLSIVLTEGLPPSNLTVYEIVALGRQPYTNWLGALADEDKTKIKAALELTQTSHLIHRKYYEISDGQLQKVLIARALAQDTALIILDEPTTHLDLLHKATLLKLLKKLTHETGKSILYSTHDLDLALQLSDEMIVMTTDGVTQDSPQNLTQNKVLDKIFNDKNIRFDTALGRFKIDHDI